LDTIEAINSIETGVEAVESLYAIETTDTIEALDTLEVGVNTA
jgi:hypothetical protein